MSQVAIYGAGPHGRVALATLKAEGRHEAILFLDDDKSKQGQHINGLPVVAPGEITNCYAAFVAVGDNQARKQILDRLQNQGLEIVSLVHPSAVVMPGVSVGRGVLICAGVVVVTGAILGDGIVLNTGVTVDHDCLVGKCAYLSPGVHTAGGVIVGQGAFVGVGASLGPDVKIGEGAVVGAGAAVLGDVDPYTFVAGVPAKFFREVRHER